jgi:hypothetical protein
MLLCLADEADDGFGAVVPAPRDVVTLKVHAADPPVDAVEGDLVGLAGQHLRPGVGQAHARRPLVMCSASGIQSSGESSGVVPGCSVRSLPRAVAYDSPVLAIRARTRRLNPACLVIFVSRAPSADPPAIATAGARSTNDAPAERWASLCLRRVTQLGRVAGGWARTVAASDGTRRPVRRATPPAWYAAGEPLPGWSCGL